MSEQRTPTKSELLAALRDSEREVLSALRVLPPAQFEQGRYEQGWNGRQILAHVASIEWTYPRLIDIARQAAAQPSGGEPAAASFRSGVDEYNARQIARREQATVEELLEEFARNRATTIAAIEGTDEALLAVPIRSGGGVTGTLGSVFRVVAVDHVIGHLREITQAG